MRSIQRRFNSFVNKNPYWSSYVCFVEAVKNQNFSKQMIHRWFYKLVEKDDYDKQDARQILKHLSWLSEKKKATEDNTI
ncbi:MAG: hypothetical protein PHY72_02665 [Candidatus Pacebacteria bacterium]|nr:hypothetical protein [Candidatus Paceibacterota bacterium]